PSASPRADDPATGRQRDTRIAADPHETGAFARHGTMALHDRLVPGDAVAVRASAVEVAPPARLSAASGRALRRAHAARRPAAAHLAACGIGRRDACGAAAGRRAAGALSAARTADHAHDADRP